MLLPIVTFTPATFNTICPAPYTAATCPQHASGSGPDIETEINTHLSRSESEAEHVSVAIRFFEALQRARRLSLHESRRSPTSASAFDTAEIYFPGGPTGTAANDHLAARGDCAFPGGSRAARSPVELHASVQRLHHRGRPRRGQRYRAQYFRHQ